MGWAGEMTEPTDWMWCYENPKEAALEIDRLMADLNNRTAPVYPLPKEFETVVLVPTWQPIDTAPTEEPECLKARLVYLPTKWNDFIVSAYYERGKWWQAYSGLDRPRIELSPTHWMPLPEPPK